MTVPDLGDQVSAPPRLGDDPPPPLALASTFNSLIFDQNIKQTPAFRSVVRAGEGGAALI